MILVATTMIVRSQGDQATASAQRQLTGSERSRNGYYSLSINSNRIIAAYKIVKAHVLMVSVLILKPL